jgi:hypothetical protein
MTDLEEEEFWFLTYFRRVRGGRTQERPCFRGLPVFSSSDVNMTKGHTLGDLSPNSL